MDRSKIRTVVSWVLVVPIALLFGMAALGKLIGAQTEMFAGWGYPAWFATVIGVIEALGAIALLVPATTRWAILGLTAIMLGAAYTHVANDPPLAVLRPGIFLAVLWGVWWLRGYGLSRRS